MTDNQKRKKKGILFLCTGNSCRSQMAEGFAKVLAPDDVLVFPAGVSSKAIKVMKEAGIDISNHYSKRIDDIPMNEIGTVITLCDSAQKMCPSFPGVAKKLHWPIPDPVGAIGSEEKVLNEFRKVRDAIKKRIEKFFKNKEYEDE